MNCFSFSSIMQSILRRKKITIVNNFSPCCECVFSSFAFVFAVLEWTGEFNLINKKDLNRWCKHCIWRFAHARMHDFDKVFTVECEIQHFFFLNILKINYKNRVRAHQHVRMCECGFLFLYFLLDENNRCVYLKIILQTQ